MRFTFTNPAAARSETPQRQAERAGSPFGNSDAMGVRGVRLQTPQLIDAKVRLHHKLIDELNLSHIEKIPRSELRAQVHGLISDYVSTERIPLNSSELGEFVDEVL